MKRVLVKVKGMLRTHLRRHPALPGSLDRFNRNDPKKEGISKLFNEVRRRYTYFLDEEGVGVG